MPLGNNLKCVHSLLIALKMYGMVSSTLIKSGDGWVCAPNNHLCLSDYYMRATLLGT